MALWHDGMPAVQWGVVIGASLAAAVSDVTCRRIPNRLTGPLLAGGLAWAGCVAGWPGLLDACAACAMLAAPYVLLFLIAGGGAGDAKLMGAIGAWVGVVAGIVVLAAVAVSGILLAAAFALARKRLRPALANIAGVAFGLGLIIAGRGKLADGRAVLPPVENMQKIPYGVAILLGVCVGAAGILIWRA